MSEIAQAGIFALGTASHAYLELDLREGADPRELVTGRPTCASRGRRSAASTSSPGLRPELWRDRVGAPAPAALHGFDEPVAGPDGFTMPARRRGL